MQTASDYSPDQLKACDSVILELHRILATYWDNIVIVGGYVPKLLADNASDPHKGTNDIDLALNHLLIPEEAYAQIHELLVNHGYVQNTDKAKQFQYFRTININGKEYTAVVDLLTGQYDVETGKGRRHEPVQDAMALKTRGADLAFSRFATVIIEGELPNKGGKDKAECKVAGATPIIVMKCAAIAGRYKDKDAYDLYYFIKYYGGGVFAVLGALKPDLNHRLVIEAIETMRSNFASEDAAGPSQVVRFLELDEDAAEITRRDVFETIHLLLQEIDKIKIGDSNESCN